MKVIIGGLSKLGREYLKTYNSKVLILEHAEAIGRHINFIKEKGYKYFPIDFRYLTQEELEGLGIFLRELDEEISSVLVMSGTSSTQSVHSITLEEWENVFSVSLKGPFFAVKQMLPYLKEKGNIVVISSMNSVMPHPKRADYSLAKAALNMWVKNLAVELKEKHIYVNAILPGYIYEEDYYNSALLYTKENGKMVGDYLISYEDVVNMIQYLLEKNFGAMNGQLFLMDKGFSL